MIALKNLLAKVEAGEWWGDMPRPACLHTDLCWKAFEGSLDAAKALHDVVLQGYSWKIPANSWTSHSVAVKSPNWQSADEDEDGGYPVFEGVAEENPARAWLIAILRALIAQEGES